MIRWDEVHAVGPASGGYAFGYISRVSTTS